MSAQYVLSIEAVIIIIFIAQVLNEAEQSGKMNERRDTHTGTWDYLCSGAFTFGKEANESMLNVAMAPLLIALPKFMQTILIVRMSEPVAVANVIRISLAKTKLNSLEDLLGISKAMMTFAIHLVSSSANVECTQQLFIIINHLRWLILMEKCAATK